MKNKEIRITAEQFELMRSGRETPKRGKRWLSGASIVVYMYLQLNDRIDEDGKAWFNIKEVAKTLNMSENVVYEVLHTLEESGLLSGCELIRSVW